MFNYSGSTLDNLLDFSVRHMFYPKKLSYNQTFYQTKFKIFLICLFFKQFIQIKRNNMHYSRYLLLIPTNQIISEKHDH